MIPWLRVVLHKEIFRFGCSVTALQTSAGSVLLLLWLLCHLPVLRITITLVIKRGMDPPSCLYPLPWWVIWWRGGLLLLGALALLRVMGLAQCSLPLHRGRPWSDPLSPCLCFIDTTASYNTNTMQVSCCWLKYAQLWWWLWRESHQVTSAAHPFLHWECSFAESLLFFNEVSETCSAENYLR